MGAERGGGPPMAGPLLTEPLAETGPDQRGAPNNRQRAVWGAGAVSRKGSANACSPAGKKSAPAGRAGASK